MKKIIEIENDLALPLKDSNVEWNLYLYKKRYKQKVINSYDTYRIDDIDLTTIYSDIHKYIIEKYINKFEICEYSSEMPKNKLGFIDLTKNDNILKSSIPLINEGILNYTLFDSRDLSLHGYILECKINNITYMRIFSKSNPIKFFKHKYSIISKNKFDELETPVLSINHSCDCILFADYSIFFTNGAESIFDLERHYKVLASTCLSKLKNYELFEDFDQFVEYASAWPKAVKFENFKLERISQFSQLSKLKKENILNLFSINYNKNGAIIFSTPEEKEKVLSFICGNLLLDFNQDGYEVSYPKKIIQ